MSLGVVYFAAVRRGAKVLVKIGHTTQDPQTRRAGLQNGCPDLITLLATVPASRSDEALLHETFRTRRIRGEWFRFSRQEAARLGSVRTLRQVRSLARKWGMKPKPRPRTVKPKPRAAVILIQARAVQQPKPTPARTSIPFGAGEPIPIPEAIQARFRRMTIAEFVPSSPECEKVSASSRGIS